MRSDVAQILLPIVKTWLKSRRSDDPVTGSLVYELDMDTSDSGSQEPVNTSLVTILCYDGKEGVIEVSEDGKLAFKIFDKSNQVIMVLAENIVNVESGSDSDRAAGATLHPQAELGSGSDSRSLDFVLLLNAFERNVLQD